MKQLLVLLFSVSLFGGCASIIQNSHGINVVNEEAYENIVDKWSDRIEDYAGLSNTITAQATIVNSEVAQAQLEQNARMYQWDQAKMATEKKEAEERLRTQTQVFVSFYSPERKWDDLAKSKTLWKVFLDVDGQRYEGKASKVKLLTKEIQSQYHYHTSFGTPYMIAFPVDTHVVDGKTSRVIFTGPISSIELKFAP